jgi:hypothetical protein
MCTNSSKRPRFLRPGPIVFEARVDRTVALGLLAADANVIPAVSDAIAVGILDEGWGVDVVVENARSSAAVAGCHFDFSLWLEGLERET